MIEVFSKRRGPWYRGRRPLLLARIEAKTLEGADLSRLRLDDANLRSALMNRAVLVDASLLRADLWNAQLASADLEGAQLTGADLSAAVLVTANLCGARLDQCNLWGANLAGARLVGASLTGADLTGARLAPANLTQANLSGAKLTNAYLWGARLEDATLRGAILIKAELSCALLARAKLDEAQLQQARLHEADLTAATLCDAQLDGAMLPSASLEQADLQRARLREADLGKANLRGAQLSDADLSGASLVAADLSEAVAQRAKLTRCDLREARLCGGQFRGAQLDDVDARQVDARQAVLTDANFCRANLCGAVFEQADLRNVNFWGADLSGADLRGANLLGATIAPQQLADVQSDASTQWPAGVVRPVRAVHTGRTEGASAAAEPVHPRVFRDHKATVVDAAMSVDGRLCLSADVSGEVLLWDPIELRSIRNLVLPAEGRAVAFLGDNGLAVIAGAARPHGGDLRLWNVQSLSEVLRLALPERPDRGILPLPGQRAILVTHRNIEAWDFDQRQPQWRCPMTEDCVSEPALTEDKQRVIWVTHEGLSMADVETGQIIDTLSSPFGRVPLAAVSGDGRHAVTAGEDLVLRLWNIETKAESAAITLEALPHCLAMDPRGLRVAVVGQNRRLRILEMTGGRLALDYELPSAASLCLRFSPDGSTLLVAGEDHCVRLIDVPSH